ncbi:sensor domain-containing diguanylate cyclase [Sporosarcina cyprini]|uniref:sensor domain-containing diguanylate cyclase n=1 Tax=Sporosarcina cyprini TaxID=2910523 RepID=UPI001EDFA0B5|nr:GGDEF domain-containing protein [Sporosarcina cyprini]MCG3089263.1 GGDEF domain-containing protein [Sporosarcina cyprini]
MQYSAMQKRVILTLWLLLFPSVLYVSIHYFPLEKLNWFDIGFNLVVYALIMMLPVRLNSVSLSLDRWVLFYVFFHYGLAVEFLFIQFGVFLLLFSDRSSTSKIMRFAGNSVIFAIVSLTSAAVYYAVGGTVGEPSVGRLALFGFLYASTYSVMNNLLLLAYFKFVKYKAIDFWDSAMKDYVITILLLPFAITLCFLTELLDNKSFLLIGIPFILVLLITRRYVQSEGLHDVLTSATAIGHQLAKNLRVEDVMDTFISKLKTVIPYENAYIIDLRQDKLVMLRVVEDGQIVEKAEQFTCPEWLIAGNGLDTEATCVYSNRKMMSKLEQYHFAPVIQSVMTTPILRGSKTEGFLILTASSRYIFTELHTKMIGVLAGYLIASIDKAKYFEKTVEKSERCGLTGLHNFRYLERKMDEEMIRYHTKDISQLSVIILDIDHFKSINDSYGHQSGNDLLCAFAELLKSHVTEGATLTRYGGEEFVVLLPDVDKQQAYKIAESIRMEVMATNFRIIPDLTADRLAIQVQMTISAGVASIPNDANDAKDLLRKADRALYIGGKQAGRNRVGVYEENQFNTVV